jgi:hypothetical protein
MKAKNISFLVLFLWMFVIQTIYADDTCQSGMRKMYLDESTASGEGSARNYVPAINFYEGSGALWFRRRVLVEPRFEVHLKAALQKAEIIESSKEQTLEGFTIVISGNKNKLSTASSDYMGYYGFTKSYIIEFDFNKGNKDADDSSYSFRYCDNDCSNDDSTAIVNGKLNYQRFDPTRDMNWDFRLMYADKKLTLYSGANQQIFSQDVDLSKTLSSNTAYIGFTGYMNGNRRELNVLGTFVCEDNFDISRMTGKFYVNEQEFDTYSFEGGENVQYLFSFINTKGQIVPHCFKEGIWTYNFALSLDCTASNYNIRKLDNYRLVLTMNACNEVGEHSIGISETSHGNGPEKKYTIKSGSLSKIVYIGHDGKRDISKTTVANGVRTLSFGTDSGDFSLKGEYMEIVLDFEITDKSGNKVDLGTNSDQMKSKANIVCNGGASTTTMRIYEDHYQVVIRVTKAATYTIIKNSYMSESIQFKVVIGGIDASASYCTLDQYNSAPTLKIGDSIKFNCYFKDGRGNEVTIQRFKEISEYDFSCEVKETSPSTKTFTQTTISDKTKFYQIEYKITENGIFNFYGYLTLKGKSNKQQMTGKIFQFYVSSESQTLSKSMIFNYYAKKWVSIDNAVIEYRNDKTGRITAIDLADSTGTLMSKYKKYPTNFDATKINVEFTSDHDTSFDMGKFKAEVYNDGGIEYIGIFNIEKKESEQYLKKSTFEYTLKITYQSITKIIKFKYNKASLNIENYEMCFHTIDLSKTKVDIEKNVQIKTDGQYQKIGKIELRTTDNYLYNYRYDKNKIKVGLTVTGEVQFEIREYYILGIYEIWAKSKVAYSGEYTITIDTTTVYKERIVSEETYAKEMRFTHSENFEKTKDEGSSHSYNYKGEFKDQNLEFEFQLPGDGGNGGLIDREDYFDKNVEITYIDEKGQTHSGKGYYEIVYDKNTKTYKFVDKFKYEGKTYTWVFHFNKGSNQSKYYIYYDQKQIKQQISVKKSYFKIVTGEVKINSYVIIDVFLVDGNGSFMDKTKINELKGNVEVKAVYSDGKEAFKFYNNQVTSSYAIRYQSQVTIGGEFKIVAYYKGEEIKCESSSSSLKITVAQYSLKQSILTIILDKTIVMETGKQITIDNKNQIPRFSLELKTESGEKTTYSSDSKFTLTITKESKTITFQEVKSNGYIQFNFDYSKQDEFKTISGECTLTLTSGSQSLSWTINLVGDGNEYSTDKTCDISKTYIEPENPVAVAGEQIVIKLEIRGKDGKRWTQVPWNVYWQFKLENSYGLKGDDIKYTFECQNGVYGIVFLKITQNVITTKGYNILTIINKENNNNYEKKINLKVKSGEFAKLKAVDDGKVVEGDVVNPPYIKFEPVDAKGNLVTDFFDGSVTKEYLNSLTAGISSEGVSLTCNNHVEENRYLIVQYKSTISTNVRVTSKFFLGTETYNYRIKSGPIDIDNSYAEMATRESGSSGDYKILIYPRDKYMNDIDNLNESHMKQFITYYQEIEKNENKNVQNCKLVAGHSSAIDVIISGSQSSKPSSGSSTSEDKDVEYNSIECSTPIDYIGNIAFHVKYTNTEIECKNCVFSVIFSEFDWSKTKTYYVNKEYYLDIQKLNEVEAKKEPTFQVTFFDQHQNVLEATSVEKLNLETKFEGADIKFCVNNSGNKKVLTLCPTTNGDDNLNKWQYITNGENYKLTIYQKEVKENSFTYKIKIIGGGEGSSEAADYSKTNFNPTKIEVIAGEEGQTTMEIRTAKGERKNYWFPNISEKIKVAFDQDQDSCSYKVEKGNLPGQYVIKVSCTKENENNGFSVTVEGKKIEQKITLVVNSGKAYYLQVVETGKFNVVSDQYTWKVNPTNDDNIDFSFKFLDKNKNEITHSVIGNGEITISSDKFGTTQSYYKFEYNESKNTYTLTDNIKQAITKHVWTITVVESNKKYTFVYTRLPGKVDVTKSSYTIDKKDYILNEKSTVEVTLRDRYEVNVATEQGRLVKEEKSTQVVTKDTKDNKYTSEVQKSTIKYTYTYTVIGKYELTVTYDGKQIGEKTEITVSYQTVDTKTSKLYYDKGDNKETFMSTEQETNIDNLKYTPFYKFYLYTSAGEKITVYDKSVKVTCKMTMVANDEEKWDLDVSQGEGFFKFAYKDGNPVFSKLPGVSYNLIINYNGKDIVYPLLLLGEKDVSPNQNYDLTNTYIEPTYKEGIAGIQYEFNIEFRAKDKLRWNYQVNLGSLVIENSYKLDDKKLKIDKKLGEKNGQMKLLITQYVSITNYNNKDNVLTLTYDNKAITQKITLHIKHAELSKLEYVNGAQDGTVVNPSTVKFIPKDAYDNLFTDLFNEKVYPKNKLEELTKATSVEKYELTTNNYVSEGKYLNVQYGCKKVTTIKLTVEYNKNTYTYKLWSGPIDAEHSYAQLEKTEGVKAGDKSTLDVYPRDVYDNVVTNVTSDDLSKFQVNYEVNKETKTEVTKTCNVNSMKSNDDHFSCQTTITKSGKIEFIVDYDSSNVNCKKCSLDITPDKLDFDKTKVIYTNEKTELSRTELNTLSVTVVPNFELFFYDKYENQITDNTEVKGLVVTTDLVVTDVKLCVANKDITKTSTLCKEANNENERKWSYVPNGENYQLIVKETTTKKEVTYKIKITGGFSDGDSGPLDASKTNIQPTKLTLTAGVEGSVQLELRTAEGKRKNYWFEKVEDNISVKFPEDVKNCTYSLAQAEKPGQYKIKYTCTIKRDAFQTTVTVEGKELTQKVTLTVVPAEPAKSKLFKTSGEEITQKDLGSVSVEEKFQMIEKLFDKYDNLITNLDDFDLSKLDLKFAPYTNTKLKYSIDSSKQANGEILITMTSQFASKHAVAGKYFPNYYDITFTHGVADASNSRYEVSKDEIFVGEEVKVYIYAYDKYNNFIDANEFKETSPYQVKYNNEKDNAMKVFTEKYSIEKKDNSNVLSYPGTFFIKGTTSVWAYIDTKPIICISCRVNVKTKDIEFGKSTVYRYESTKKDYEPLKNGTVEKNTKEYPVYRLYPRDEYENTVDVIPVETLNKYKAHFKSQNSSTVYTLTLNNEGKSNQAYAEFVANDTINKGVEWETLVGGYYDLVFEYTEKRIIYNITIEGDGKGGSNDPADNQHTNINEMNLKYVAGNTGYMILEMRTKDNIRRNSWDENVKFDIKSCDSTDKTFSFKQENAGTRGVYYITVTTQKANTFPKLVKCPLTISVNNEVIKNLKPEMEVSPDVVVRTQILEKYYKDGKTPDYLVDGNADKPYSFEVKSFDQYNNLAETIEKDLDLKVSYIDGNSLDVLKDLTSQADETTGYRKYTVTVTRYGTYVISTDRSGPKGLYLEKESKFNVVPGTIDLSKTVIKAKDTPIKAGSKAAITIECYDKNNNPLNVKDYQDKFTATFVDAGNTKHESKSGFDDIIKKVTYTTVTTVNIVGNVKVDVVYEKKQKVDTSKVVIVVIPADPDPLNSVLSREVSPNTWTQYKNGDSFTVDTSEMLLLNITLYDKYNNKIPSIPSDANVVNPLMSGNDMDEIKFTTVKNKANFDLHFNSNGNYVHTYQHLTSGTYDLTYTVKTTLGEAPFKYHIIIKKDDNGHGNGPYDLSKCVLKPKNVSFVAGNYEHFTLELRTTKGLLYNDDIDTEQDIGIQTKKINKPLREDKTFRYSIEKTTNEYGIYTITIYSEKKGIYNMDVLLANPFKNKTKENVGPAEFTVYPEKVPHKNFTVFFSKPEGRVPAESIMNITFTLADRFDNLFEGRHDCVDEPYLSLLNNDAPLKVVSMKLIDDVYYEILVKPKYPPKNMSMNVLYNDGDDSVYCFPENINVYVVADIDFTKTEIVSRNKELIYVGDMLDMWLYTFDKLGECYDEEDYSKAFTIEVIGPEGDKRLFTSNYNVRRTNNNELECNNEYQIITKDPDNVYTISGQYKITVFANKTVIAKYNQTCLPLGYEKFYLELYFDKDNVSVLDVNKFKVTGTDRYGNRPLEPLIDDIDITLTFIQDNSVTNITYDKFEKKRTEVDFDLSVHKVGKHQMHLWYQKKEVLVVNEKEDLPILTVLSGPCRAEDNRHFNTTMLTGWVSQKPVNFTFQCYDIYENKITKGGENFTVTVDLVVDKETTPTNYKKIYDNGDGSYNVSFLPDTPGTYIIRLKVDDGIKYGQDVEKDYVHKTCKGATPVMCPNFECATDYYACIVPPNGCPKEKPFKCPVNGVETCVKSQIECDCPEGWIRCDYMKYCVPAERPWMCPDYKLRRCQQINSNWGYFADGICRDKNYVQPTQIVCPFGKVLCADLTCKDEHILCPNSTETPLGRTRCVDQQVTKYAYECASTITCPNKDQVVCSDGACVENEIFCAPIRECPYYYPHLCNNNVCVANATDCMEGIACGDGNSLCYDYICRERCDGA